MNTAMQNLNFIINLTDRVSGPMHNVMRSIDQASAGFQKGFNKIAYGTAGLAASAYTISNLLEPTKNMNRALGEVRSLSVAEDVLSNLQKTALGFSVQYGESAADFVRSSYDIQSAIAGLSGNELPEFTRASALLAKGTKANVGDITGYVGTMFNIFEKQADAMGHANWVNQLAGQTAMAVQIFKTTGKGMSDAFSSVGAAPTLLGVAMSEQIAVLGKLSATKSGAEAGTMYRAFLDSVGTAQEKLGLKFVDTQGHMLPMINILERIRVKFGEIDTVAEADALKKAFGTGEAVALIKLLSKNIGGLKTDIATIGDQTGIQKAIDMANAMTDPWARVSAGIEAVSISIGSKLMPMLTPLLDSINQNIHSFWAWTEANPALAKNLGQIGLTLIGITAAASAFTLFSGLATVSTTLWKLSLNLVLQPLWGLGKALWAALPSIWAFTSALFANPITWWVIGIAALTAGVIAAVVYWKEWTGVVIDFAGRFLEMIGVFTLVDNALAAWEGLKNWWTGFKAWLASLNPFGSIIAGLNNVIGMANKIPGVNISPLTMAMVSTAPLATTPAPVSTGPKGAAAGGGLMKQFSSVMTSNSSKTIGDVHVHNYGQPMSGTKLLDELIFAGG